MTSYKKPSKFFSRKWVHTQEVFVSATILAWFGKLSWEWMAVISIAFWGYGIFDSIIRIATDLGRTAANLMKTMSKEDAMEIIDKLTEARKNGNQ